MTLLTIAETAIKLRISQKKVRELVEKDKTFPCFSYSTRSNRVIAEKLNKWVLKKAEKNNA
jgi:hypothetical protein